MIYGTLQFSQRFGLLFILFFIIGELMRFSLRIWPDALDFTFKISGINPIVL